MPCSSFRSPSRCLFVALLAGMPALLPPLPARAVEESPLPQQALRIGRSDANAQGHAVVAICLDQAQPAWTLLYAVLPQDAGRPCAHPDMQRVLRRDFPALERRLRAWLVYEVQPEAGVASRVLALARQQPGMPVGLTWDGGMAVTAGDYTAAERRLETYRADPAGYAARYWRE